MKERTIIYCKMQNSKREKTKNSYPSCNKLYEYEISNDNLWMISNKIVFLHFNYKRQRCKIQFQE